MGLTKKEEILNFANDKKILLNADALKTLEIREDWENILNEFLKENKFMITAEMIKKKIIKTKINLVEKEVIIKNKGLKPEAKETSSNYRILDELDVTNKSFSEGKINDFKNCFQDKYTFLASILKKKQALNPRNIKHLKKMRKNEKIDLIGMVTEKWVTKKGHLALRIEDLEDECIAIIGKQEEMLREEKKSVMLDDVIGINGIKLSDELILIKKIYYPDMTIKKMKTIPEDIAFASISDIHLGSKLFLRKEFEKFIDWINLKVGSEKEKKETGKIKYLFILGDNVEGIGIYPEQFDELEIKDNFEQYKALEELLNRIPEYIKVFMIPGQHDAVRWADPRPAIPQKLMPNLDYKQFHMLGSPGWVEFEGMLALLYHGNSMHDLFANINGLSAAKPNEGSKELLKRRDLMVSFGLSQPYVLEPKDYLLIRKEPDFFLLGDIHRIAVDEYKGTTIINNSTWQERTAYQVKLGHYPTPGIAVTVNLKTRKITKKVFVGAEIA